MYTSQTICNYLIAKCVELDIYLDLLKLQKILYYCQAWSLANDRGAIFEERFQAWIQGPVLRSVYDRFISKGIYSEIRTYDVFPEDSHIDNDTQHLISLVLHAYGSFTGDQLEYLTHQETPWLEARKGHASNERSEEFISEEIMKTYYASKIKDR